MRYEDEHRKDVVCAILSRREGNEEQFLIGSRSGSKVFKGLFEFLEGKVEHGESLASALKREIREELGAEVEVKGLFMHPFPFDYSETRDIVPRKEILGLLERHSKIRSTIYVPSSRRVFY